MRLCGYENAAKTTSDEWSGFLTLCFLTTQRAARWTVIRLNECMLPAVSKEELWESVVESATTRPQVMMASLTEFSRWQWRLGSIFFQHLGGVANRSNLPYLCCFPNSISHLDIQNHTAWSYLLDTMENVIKRINHLKQTATHRPKQQKLIGAPV